MPDLKYKTQAQLHFERAAEMQAAADELRAARDALLAELAETRRQLRAAEAERDAARADVGRLAAVLDCAHRYLDGNPGGQIGVFTLDAEIVAALAERQTGQTRQVLSRDDMLAMVTAMNKYGGSFVQSLSECFILADHENLTRLYAAWPEYVQQYHEMAQA